MRPTIPAEIITNVCHIIRSFSSTARPCTRQTYPPANRPRIQKAMDQKRDANHVEEPKRFEPKKPVQLDPPKDDPITLDYLVKCDGICYCRHQLNSTVTLTRLCRH